MFENLSGSDTAHVMAALSPAAEMPPAPLASLVPDVDQAMAFFDRLLPAVGTVHLRAVPEPKDQRTPTNHHLELGPDFREKLKSFLAYCTSDGRAAFVLPGLVSKGGTHGADVLSFSSVLLDLDTGDVDAKRAEAEALIGPASLIIESGGRTKEGAIKVHLHWALSEPAAGSDIAVACRVRELLAARCEGDPSFKKVSQVVRISGSWHRKGEPILTRIREQRDVRYSLDDLVKALDVAPVKPTNVLPFSLGINDVKPDINNTTRALTQPVHEGAVDDITRFDAAGVAIGHYLHEVRDGRLTEAEAWERTKAWNIATLIPPWPEDRLRGDFDHLLARELKSGGPFTSSVATQATEWSIDDWSIDRFEGAAPERQWLVEGLLPLGTAGAFAAAGDSGKSMMALWLAYLIGCYPEPNPNATFDFSTPRFFGCPVRARGAAVLLTAEDDTPEIHRRIATLDRANLRRNGKQRVFVVPMPNVGGVRAIIREGKDGAEPTPFWIELRKKLLAIPDLKLVVLDPLSAFAGADVETDNATAAALMFMLGEFAVTSGATVIVTHHMKKGDAPTSLAEARLKIRGAGAIVENGRWALALWEADENKKYKTLKAVGQKERNHQSGTVFEGGLVKGNAPGAKVIRTFVRNAATGLLEDVTDQARAGTPDQTETDAKLHAALVAHHRANNPRFSFTSSASALYAAWGTIIRKLDLPISKDGKSKEKDGIVDVFNRMLDRGWLQQTGDPGPPRYGVVFERPASVSEG